MFWPCCSSFSFKLLYFRHLCYFSEIMFFKELSAFMALYVIHSAFTWQRAFVQIFLSAGKRFIIALSLIIALNYYLCSQFGARKSTIVNFIALSAFMALLFYSGSFIFSCIAPFCSCIALYSDFLCESALVYFLQL